MDIKEKSTTCEGDCPCGVLGDLVELAYHFKQNTNFWDHGAEWWNYQFVISSVCDLDCFCPDKTSSDFFENENSKIPDPLCGTLWFLAISNDRYLSETKKKKNTSNEFSENENSKMSESLCDTALRPCAVSNDRYLNENNKHIK